MHLLTALQYPRPEFVAADLSKVKLAEALAATSFDPTKTTLFTAGERSGRLVRQQAASVQQRPGHVLRSMLVLLALHQEDKQLHGKNSACVTVLLSLLSCSLAVRAWSAACHPPRTLGPRTEYFVTLCSQLHAVLLCCSLFCLTIWP
eukprot:GHRQ01034652.1.p1 GENE.GHRQ01034652.1~~GHRQ01034652.1.p1  ORF type:complete len:147 (-),score=27.95 GHRQ01034652.1:194-634(-)